MSPGIGMVPTSRINILPGHNNRPAVMDPVLGDSLASNLGRIIFEKHISLFRLGSLLCFCGPAARTEEPFWREMGAFWTQPSTSNASFSAANEPFSM